MLRVDTSCNVDVSVSLMLNSEDSIICDNCKSLARADVGSSSTSGSIVVEISSREREKVCMYHIGRYMTMSVSIVRRSLKIIKFNTMFVIIKQ